MNDHHDLVVVGAGIVGLATALRLVERDPRLRVVVVDKEPDIARHQTGHNSGVVHRGVYYTPGSLKAQLCVSGADRLVDYCDRYGIRVDAVGKVIVALDDTEVPALLELYRRALANGVRDVTLIDRERLNEIEPHAAGVQALHSPHTSVVNFVAVARAYAADFVARGGEVRLSQTVVGLHERGDGVTVATRDAELTARNVIVCAGLQSDRLAGMSDRTSARRMKIVPFRGDYYVLRPERRDLVRGLIYPVPDPRFPFLGVHFTIRHDGEVWAGPNAVLAFRREGYARFDLSIGDLAETLTYRGFWRVAARHWRVGAAEIWRDYVRSAFVAALRRYVPEIRDDDLEPGPSGVRAQAVGVDGALVDDFSVMRSGRTLHVRNAPSPGATSSLAIADLIVDRAVSELGVGG